MNRSQFLNNFLNNFRHSFGKTLVITLFLIAFGGSTFAQTPTFRGRLLNENGSQFATVEAFGTDISNYWSRVWMSSNKLRIVFPAKSNENGYYYSRYIEYSYYAGDPLNTKYWVEFGGGWMAINLSGVGYMMADYEVIAFSRVAVSDTWKYFRLTE